MKLNIHMGWVYGKPSEINGQNYGGYSTIKVGNGRKTFWNDVWVGHSPLRQQFPDIYNLNQQKVATISEVKGVQGWNFTFRMFLNDREVGRLTEFYNILEQAKSLTNEVDSLMWKKDKNGKFKVKSAYKFFDNSTQAKALWPWKMIWKGKVACGQTSSSDTGQSNEEGKTVMLQMFL